MLTGAQLQKVNEATAELRRQMKPAAEWVTEVDESLFGNTFLSDAERNLLKNVRDELPRAEEWLTTWRSWAERGLNQYGEPYPVSFYLRVGADLAAAFAAYTKLQVQAGAFILGQTVEASLEDLGSGLERAGSAAGGLLKGVEDAAKALGKPWALSTKILVGFAGVGLLALLGSAVVKKLPNLNSGKEGGA